MSAIYNNDADRDIPEIKPYGQDRSYPGDTPTFKSINKCITFVTLKVAYSGGYVFKLVRGLDPDEYWDVSETSHNGCHYKRKDVVNSTFGKFIGWYERDANANRRGQWHHDYFIFKDKDSDIRLLREGIVMVEIQVKNGK